MLKFVSEMISRNPQETHTQNSKIIEFEVAVFTVVQRVGRCPRYVTCALIESLTYIWVQAATGTLPPLAARHKTSTCSIKQIQTSG